MPRCTHGLARLLRNARFPLALFVAGLVVRLHWNLEVHPLEDYVYSDMRGYWTRAARFAAAPFEARPYQAFYPPGVHLLAGIVRMAVGADAAWTVLDVVYAIFGALVPPAVYGICRAAGTGRLAAALAGAVMVAHYPSISLGGYLLSEPPFAAALAGSTYLALRFLAAGHRRDAVACGLCLGLGAWFRPQILAVVPFWLALFFYARRRFAAAPKVVTTLACPLVAALCLVPTAVHVHHHTGRWGLVSENGSLNLVFGRCHATGVVAHPAEPGQVRTAFSPPSLLQLARRKSRPGRPFPQLDPAGALRIEYDGYIGDARIHRKLVRECMEATGLARQLRYAAVHVWMLAYDNVMWPDSGRRMWRAPAKWWERTIGRTVVPLAAVALVVSVVGLWRRAWLPLLVLAGHPLALLAVAAVFFGSIRLRVPYDGLLVAMDAVFLSLVGRSGVRGARRLRRRGRGASGETGDEQRGS
ncbi:MAG: phospholipid carrier-dependent glycosyltransferase [Deltaproteobacteria bacterium]|nr:MAG: phospholipid carrier-dependent glycosyltransferase [Deltaproteobacteria bacterium]